MDADAVQADVGVQLPGKEIPLTILDEPGFDPRRFNCPTASEVAVILPDQGPGVRDIRVLRRGGRIQSISELHPDYNPLAYVLLFPTGSPSGWHPGLLQNGVNAPTRPRKLTCCQHAAYRLFCRSNQSNHLHLTAKLFHQYIVDCYAQVEQGRLNFIRHNQPQLRADLNQGVSDAVSAGDTNARELGRRIVLPSSFISS